MDVIQLNRSPDPEFRRVLNTHEMGLGQTTCVQASPAYTKLEALGLPGARITGVEGPNCTCAGALQIARSANGVSKRRLKRG